MSPRRGAEIDRLDAQRHRDHQKPEDRERPEYVDIGQQIDLVLQVWPIQAIACPAASLAFDPGASKKRVIESMVC